MASDQVVTVPNLLSLARLVLAIVFFVALEQSRPVAAFWLFAIAASTDWVDGWYARRFNQVSRLGRIFDPLVDKVIVCGAYVLLAAAGTAIAPWMAVVVTVDVPELVAVVPACGALGLGGLGGQGALGWRDGAAHLSRT